MKVLLAFLLGCIALNSFSQEKDLRYFMDKAQKNSPLLVDYKNQIQSATLDSLLNIATRKPQVTGSVYGNYAPVIQGFGYDTTLSNGQMLTGLVGVNQKLVTKNNRSTQLQSFKLIKDALAVTKKIAIKDLNRNIISQYITATATLEQLANTKKMATLLHDEASILKKLTQNSVYKQTDYLIFMATVKQQEIVVLQLQQQYQNDLGLLYYLSGEVDTTSVNLPKPIIALQNKAMIGKSIFFQTFEKDSLKFQNQNKTIDFAYKPSISLLADAGYMSALAYLPYKNFGASLGVGLSVPIYDGKQRNLQHQKITTLLETNLAYQTNFKKQYQQQLAILNQQLKQIEQLETQLQSQLLLADALIEANKKLLLTGDAQITEFILAIGSILNIQSSISQNHIHKLQVINEINYWNTND